jgi:hypothetical protein
MLDTNLWGTMITCREALKHFGNAGGSIINARCSERSQITSRVTSPGGRESL